MGNSLNPRTALAALLVLAVLAFVAFPPDVLAATYALDCAAASTDENANCAALAERLEAAVAELEAQSVVLADIESNTSGAGVISGTVALSAADRERSDLSWYGIWAVVGLLLVLVVAPLWNAAWRFWRD